MLGRSPGLELKAPKGVKPGVKGAIRKLEANFGCLLPRHLRRHLSISCHVTMQSLLKYILNYWHFGFVPLGVEIQKIWLVASDSQPYFSSFQSALCNNLPQSPQISCPHRLHVLSFHLFLKPHYMRINPIIISVSPWFMQKPQNRKEEWRQENRIKLAIRFCCGPSWTCSRGVGRYIHQITTLPQIGRKILGVRIHNA